MAYSTHEKTVMQYIKGLPENADCMGKKAASTVLVG